jgi:excisionase family DNA binding protein
MNKRPTTPRQLLTVADTATRLGLREPTIRRWISDGRIKAIRIGTRSVRIPVEQIDELLAKNDSNLASSGGSLVGE